MASVRLPIDAFVIIWVSSAYYSPPRQFRGDDIYLLTCLPSELEMVQSTFIRHKIIFANDDREAMKMASEAAERMSRRPHFIMGSAEHCQIVPSAAA